MYIKILNWKKLWRKNFILDNLNRVWMIYNISRFILLIIFIFIFVLFFNFQAISDVNMIDTSPVYLYYSSYPWYFAIKSCPGFVDTLSNIETLSSEIKTITWWWTVGEYWFIFLLLEWNIHILPFFLVHATI